MTTYILCVIVNPGKVLYIVLIYPCKVSWIGTIHCTAVVLCVGVSILFKVLNVLLLLIVKVYDVNYVKHGVNLNLNYNV